jgi:hypothetical protein
LGLPTKSVFKNIKKHAVHNINILAWVPRAIAHRPQALVSFKKYMPPPLPYFKVNFCPLPLPHFASIFFAYL